MRKWLATCLVKAAGLLASRDVNFCVVSTEEYREALAYKPDYERLQGDHKSDMLAAMLKRQRELYDLNGFPSIDYSRPLGRRATEVLTQSIGDFVTSLHHEACELQNWLPWKAWSKRLGNKSDVEWWSEQHILEMRMEVIDLVCFIFNICCILGIDYKTLYELYNDKMDVNINDRHNSGKY